MGMMDWLRGWLEEPGTSAQAQNLTTDAARVVMEASSDIGGMLLSPERVEVGGPAAHIHRPVLQQHLTREIRAAVHERMATYAAKQAKLYGQQVAVPPAHDLEIGFFENERWLVRLGRPATPAAPAPVDALPSEPAAATAAEPVDPALTDDTVLADQTVLAGSSEEGPDTQPAFLAMVLDADGRRTSRPLTTGTFRVGRYPSSDLRVDSGHRDVSKAAAEATLIRPDTAQVTVLNRAGAVLHPGGDGRRPVQRIAAGQTCRLRLGEQLRLSETVYLTLDDLGAARS